MRIQSAKVRNFGSYKELDVDFTAQGLILIKGATGSGKSTLCDIIPWGLSGRTAKGGSVDEVIAWPGNEVTKVILYLENVTISRSRGLKAKDNDLFFWPVDGIVTRGKDLQDTQKMINNLLQVDIDLYLAGAYFHEFSQTAQFFTATAKNRRLICEQIVDLRLATTLQPKVSDSKKAAAKASTDAFNKLVIQNNVLLSLQQNQEYEKNRAKNWKSEQVAKITILETKYKAFEDNKVRNIKGLSMAYEIDLLANRTSKKCSGCGRPTDGNPDYDNVYLKSQITAAKKSENPYLEQLAVAMDETSPFDGGIKNYTDQINTAEAKIIDLADFQGKHLIVAEDLELLENVLSEYRSVSIMNAINQIETKTNQLLTDHFDAEIKVILEVEGADKLEVRLLKDGNNCSFTQLSKGQRQLLKLCFAIALMQAVSNQSGVNFNQVFFDEATDGLDTEMKLKAYGMLETLSQQYESIFLVEHSEDLKAMANNSYRVELINGESHVEKV